MLSKVARSAVARRLGMVVRRSTARGMVKQQQKQRMAAMMRARMMSSVAASSSSTTTTKQYKKPKMPWVSDPWIESDDQGHGGGGVSFPPMDHSTSTFKDPAILKGTPKRSCALAPLCLLVSVSTSSNDAVVVVAVVVVVVDWAVGCVCACVCVYVCVCIICGIILLDYYAMCMSIVYSVLWPSDGWRFLPSVTLLLWF
jgi:hypothetical protein